MRQVEARRTKGEIRLRRHDGSYRWHIVRVEPRRDADGALAGWVGTSTDVHDRRLAEEAIERSERRLGQLVETLGDALYTLDREWRIERFNAGAEAMFGRPRETVVGRVWLEAFPALGGTEFQTRYERTMATGEPQAFEGVLPRPRPLGSTPGAAAMAMASRSVCAT